jgi:hypothetical protein
MNDKILKSSIKIKRNPAISFFLSIFFTGAGETYNGDLSKGLIIFSLKTIALLIFPLLIFFRATDSYIFPFVFTASIVLTIQIFSAIYASYKSHQKKKSSVKKYNNIFFYLIFIILNIIISIYTLSIIYSSIGIIKVKNIDNMPSLIQGDVVLSLKYLPHGLKKGDLIITENGIISRIIAIENENFKIIKDSIILDYFPLEREILSENDLKKYSIEFGEKLVFEINNRRKYPVISDESLLSGSNIKNITVKANNVLTGRDNRSDKNQFEEVPMSKIKGRIEGIIFSKNWKRIASKPFESKKTD